MNALKTSLLCIALASAWPVAAQEMDHSKMDHSKMAMPETPKPTETDPAKKKAEPEDEPAPMDHSKMDHAAMGHDMSGMPVDSSMPGMQHDEAMAPEQPRTPIPPITDADRAAAQPPGGHMAHLDNGIHSYSLLNRLEGWDADPGKGLAWEGQGWIGTDLDRLWWRSEGERVDGHTESADIEVLYGRSVSTWWDVVAGVRHDFKPGDSQSFAAFGVQGLAPQKFEVSATAYVGERGQTAARFEVEYELLLTNRLILQPLVEVDLYGKDDPARGIGSGLSTAEAGLRLRYEFSRRFAPYIGVVHERAFGNTADLRREEGEGASDTRFVVGVRAWF
ncbi:copper resistance protein B [Pseudoxanthomonas helianthi]|uniref:Copper resistance protein B n=1 Tax=Pseudoxanthomonas helianthi TaxID=1453541 RepID=A0A940X578_9GAMM|nr:copper resistance protein B [Pseudoxanthomonas helianthi]MBP3985357.1 copper resistance protein B [Pseudoxanthomonas helianthi]